MIAYASWFEGRRQPAANDSAPMVRARPMAPHAYLTLRRTAAGLSEHQAAALIARDAAGIGAALDLVRLLETGGTVARSRDTLMCLRRAYAFDPDVYFQLADHAPGHAPQVCQGCGCSRDDACVSPNGHDRCHWHDDAQCSRCAGLAPALGRVQ